MLISVGLQCLPDAHYIIHSHADCRQPRRTCRTLSLLDCFYIVIVVPSISPYLASSTYSGSCAFVVWSFHCCVLSLAATAVKILDHITSFINLASLRRACVWVFRSISAIALYILHLILIQCAESE